MFKKLGKKGLLSLLTVAAVVVTTVGSFAVWDSLTATSNGMLTLAKPIEVQAVAMGEFTEAKEYDAAPVYTQNVTFNVNVDDVTSGDTLQLDLNSAIKNGDADVTGNFDITLESTGDGTAPLEGTTDKVVEGTNVYKLTITPKSDTANMAAATALAKAGSPLTVEVTGELSKQTTP